MTADRSSAGGSPSILAALWEHRVILVVAVVLAAALAYALSSLRDEAYTAEARLFISPTTDFSALDTGGGWTGEPERFVANRAELAASGPVLARAAAQLGSPWDAEVVGRRVEARPSTTVDVITIEARGSSPEVAVALVEAVTGAYREAVAERVAEQVASAEELAGEQLPAVRTRAAVYGDGLAAVEAPEVPERPASPQPLRDALIAGLLAGIAVGIVAFLRHEGRGSWDAAELLHAPHLADVTSHRSGDFDALAVTLLVRTAKGGRHLGIASASSGELDLSVAVQTAAALARQSGDAALVVGPDRAEDVAAQVGIPLDPSSSGEGSSAARPRWEVDAASAVTLLVLDRPVGPALGKRLEGLAAQHEQIVVPIGRPGEDAAALAAAAQLDGVLVVVDAGTRSADLRRLADRLEVVGGAVLGVVAVDAAGTSPDTSIT